MATLRLDRTHTFARREAGQRLEAFAEKKAKETGVDVNTTDTGPGTRQMEFTHPNFSGTAHITDDEATTEVAMTVKSFGFEVPVRVGCEDQKLSFEAKLPMAASLFKGEIERQIEGWMTEALD